VPRHQAQRIGYVLRKTGVAREAGKRSNAILYRLVTKRQADAALRKKRPKVSRTIDFDDQKSVLLKPVAAAKKPVKKRKTTIAKPKATTRKKATKRQMSLSAAI